MINVFKMIPRLNVIYVSPICGKERAIKDVCYDIVAQLSLTGNRVRQLVVYEKDNEYVIEVTCSRYAFYTFLNQFKDKTSKLIWRVNRVV